MAKFEVVYYNKDGARMGECRCDDVEEAITPVPEGVFGALVHDGETGDLLYQL